MPEGGGGLFSWKLQRLIRPMEAASGERPEIDPPDGMVWHHNPETCEWRLVPEGEDHYLNEETPRMLVDGGPLFAQEDASVDEWEVLSDRISQGSHAGASIMVPRGGSTTLSITSLDNSSANFSVPYRVQKTLSSSTIDSAEAGTFCSHISGVLGVDYVEHIILPSDTIQGLCLAYKISPTRLRQVNHFSGNSLVYAPKKLVIPLTKKALRSGFIRVQDKESTEYKIYAFLAEVPSLKPADAKSYLELANWNVYEAIESAREDHEWEQEVASQDEATGGNICIKVKVEKGVAVGFRAQGAGDKASYGKMESVIEESPSSDQADSNMKSTTNIVTDKNVSPQDLFDAAPQHGNFGVELQFLPKKPST